MKGRILMINIRKGGHKDLERYYPAMEMDFDSEELISKLLLHKAMMSGEAELMIFFDDESNLELGYALVLVKNLYNYVLLKYFAILPWYRDKGVGVAAMRLLNKRYADKQGILAEITEFDDPEVDHIKKLYKFFARFGYIEVPCDYKIGGVKANLMAKPIKGSALLAPVAHRVIIDFYSRILRPSAMFNMIDIKRAAEEPEK
jgi:hypothetical protein